MKMAMRAFLLLNALTLALSIPDLPIRPAKKEEMMMRTQDGTYLHTLIYFPRDYSDGQALKLPTVMDRSPYGYGDMEWITDVFMPFGYVAVGQDMRGTEKSEGNFSMWHSDASDSTDLGDWITHQSWSNGEIYTMGFSADGMGEIQTLKSGNDWLKGQYVGWAPSRLYEILFPGGTYKQKTVEDWLRGVTMPTPSVVEDCIQTVYEHEAYDYYWKEIELQQPDYGKMKGQSAFWAGWYDLFLRGNLDMFQGYNDFGEESVRHTSQLLVDPCGHCLEAQPYFEQNAVEGRTALGVGQMLETFGIKSSLPAYRKEIKNITFYVMSSNDTAGLSAGNYWTSVEKWPAPTMVDYYLHADKSTSTLAPTEAEAPSSSYVHDPSDPVPTIGGSNLPDSIGGSIPCGPMDQAPLNDRTDVLTFTTVAQSEGEVLAITGPMTATLFVSSDAVDTDFMVKISDVYPTGEVRILQDNAIRMRWREVSLDPVYMSKGEVYQVEISLWNTSYIVAPGHALRIAVSSSNFPRFSVNPNNGLLLADPTYPGVNVTATNVLYHSVQYPSRVSLPVVRKYKDLPFVDLVKVTRLAFPHLTDDMLAKAEKYFAQKRG